MNDALISIIVPIYNVEKYIEECLYTISKQTYSNFEVICVDDGSTDRSPGLAQSFCKRDKRFFYYHKGNGGLSSARNYGIERAKGEHIVFIDSDDFVKNDFLEKLYNSINKTNADISMCGYVEYDYKYHIAPIICNFPCVNNLETHTVDKFSLWKEYHSNKYNSCGCTVVWNKIYKKSLFTNIRFEEGKIFEDEYINYRLFDICKCITIISDCLYCYRRNRSGSITKQYTGGQKQHLIPILMRNIFFIQNKYPLELSRTYYSWFESVFLFDTDKNLQFDKFYRKYIFSLFVKGPYSRTILKSFIKMVFKPLYIRYLNFKKKTKKVNIDKLAVNSDVLYIGSPSHGNLGDQAISIATCRFLNNSGLNFDEISFDDYYQHYEYIHSLSPKLIILQGGGNIGNAWIVEEKLRWDVILSFPNSKIIVFPQTAWFENDINKETTIINIKNVYSSHKQLTIVAREKHSYNVLREMCSANVILCPDIVLSNTPKNKQMPIDKFVLVLQRKDKEKDETSQKNIANLVACCEKLGYKIVYGDTVVDKKVDKTNRNFEVDQILKLVEKAYFVITDRLHGMIFSYITSTPAIVFGNYNYKVSGTYDILKEKHLILYLKDLGIFDNFLNDVYEYYQSNDRVFETIFSAYGSLEEFFDEK